jgi:hypothetical protein
MPSSLKPRIKSLNGRIYEWSSMVAADTSNGNGNRQPASPSSIFDTDRDWVARVGTELPLLADVYVTLAKYGVKFAGGWWCERSLSHS